MAVAMIGPKFYAWDRNGKPLAFGKLFTYQARTNVPKATYQSEDQVVENTNPVILNGEGYANVYLSGSYKMVLKDDKDNEIWSSDPVSSAQPEEWVICLTATYVSSTIVKVEGNFTNEYEVGRRVRVDNNLSEYSYSTVAEVYYVSGETVITLVDPVVTTGVREVCSAIVGPNSEGGIFRLEGGASYIGNAGIQVETVDKLVSVDWAQNTPDGTLFATSKYNADVVCNWVKTQDEPADGFYLQGAGCYFKLLGSGLTPRHYGAYADLEEDDTPYILLAMEHESEFFNFLDDEYLIKTATSNIPHNFIANNLRLVWDGDEDVILSFDGIAIFKGGNARELVKSGKAKQNRLFQGTGTIAHYEFNTDGFGTAFDSIEGDLHINVNCKSTDIRGFSPQFGYGVNSSSKVTFVHGYQYSAMTGNNGRHAVYINGSVVESFSIRDLIVNGCYLNPVNVRVTDTENKVFGFVDSVAMKDVFLASGGDEPSLSAALNITNPDSNIVDGVIKVSKISADNFRGGLVRLIGYKGSTISDVSAKNGLPGTNNVHLVAVTKSDYSSVDKISVMDTELNSNGNLVDVSESSGVTVTNNSGEVSAGRSAVRFGSGCTDCVADNADVPGFTNDYEDTDGVNSIRVKGFSVTPFIDKSGESTPSVKYIERIVMTEAANIDVTFFDDGVEGQEIVLVAQSGNVTIKYDSTKIDTKSNADVALGLRDTFRCVKRGSRWIES